MTNINYFKDTALALASNGYLPIPIAQGSKAGAVKHWQTYRYHPGDDQKYSSCGVGILCGQGKYPIAGIDCDTRNEKLAHWVMQQVNDVIVLGRVGLSPKILFPVRLKEGLAKMSSHCWDDGLEPSLPDKQRKARGHFHQLEILGHGQQFVSFGIHPVTHRPYEWGMPWDSEQMDPTTVPAWELKCVDEQFLRELIDKFDRQCACLGWTIKSQGNHTGRISEGRPLDALDAAVRRLPEIDIKKARSYLQFLSSESYDLWIRVGLGLHQQFAGSDEAYHLWDEWSSLASSYKGDAETAAKWAGFGRYNGEPVTMRTIIKLAEEARKNSEKAARCAAFDELKRKIEACGEAYDLKEIAEKANLTEAEDKAALIMLIKARYKELTGEVIEKRIVQQWMPPVNLGGYHLTEEGNARRMVDRYKGGIRYVAQTAEWLLWTGVYWRRASEAEIRALARKTVDTIYKEAETATDPEAKEKLRKFATVSSRAYMYNAMVQIAQTMDGVLTDANELDANPRFFGVANGEVDLYTGTFSDGVPSHLITRRSSVNFDATATCPLWDAKILEILGSPDRVDFYHKLRGYSMLANPKEHKLPIYFGNGSNGKSTVVAIERRIMGNYGVTADPDTFIGGVNAASGGGPREDIVRLNGARAVYVNEPDEGVLREGIVKSLTGQDEITARGIHAKASVSFIFQGVITMVANHQPIIKDSTDGVWRRILAIAFRNKFEGKAVDKDLKEKLEAELPGILNRFLEGARKYQKEGLNIPPDIEADNALYRNDMDLLKEWLNECCELGPNYFALTSDLFKSWKAYATERGELGYIPSARSLGRQLAGRNFRPRKDARGAQGRGFLGLRLKGFEDVGDEDEPLYDFP